MTLYTRRRATNLVILTLSLFATGLGLLFLFLILGALLYHGLPALSFGTFTHATPAPGNQGGLSNAIYGSVVDDRRLPRWSARRSASSPAPTSPNMAAAAGSRRWCASSTTSCLSAPSIVIGLFVYALVVVPMGHFSAWAGSDRARDHRRSRWSCAPPRTC